MTTAMLLPLAVPASVERDAWDWYLSAASLLAAITAIILFLPWALERRRRPEVRIEWALSLDGNPAKLDHWPADYVPHITPGQAVSVRIAVHNVGDRASQAALTNFAVPDCFDLRRYSDLEANPPYSGNPTAGLPPDFRVAYFAPGLEPWTPGNSFLYVYRLIYPTSRNRDQPLRARLLFDITDSRFNRGGRRWLPSLVPPLELGHAHAGESWGGAATPPPPAPHDSNGFTLNPAVAWPVHKATAETSATSSCSRRRKLWPHQRRADAACWTTPDGGSHAWSTGCRLRTSSGPTGFCRRESRLRGTPARICRLGEYGMTRSSGHRRGRLSARVAES
jgi:hypothetical protein